MYAKHTGSDEGKSEPVAAENSGFVVAPEPHQTPVERHRDGTLAALRAMASPGNVARLRAKQRGAW